VPQNSLDRLVGNAQAIEVLSPALAAPRAIRTRECRHS